MKTATTQSIVRYSEWSFKIYTVANYCTYGSSRVQICAVTWSLMNHSPCRKSLPPDALFIEFPLVFTKGKKLSSLRILHTSLLDQPLLVDSLKYFSLYEFSPFLAVPSVGRSSAISDMVRPPIGNIWPSHKSLSQSNHWLCIIYGNTRSTFSNANALISIIIRPKLLVV